MRGQLHGVLKLIEVFEQGRHLQKIDVVGGMDAIGGASGVGTGCEHEEESGGRRAGGDRARGGRDARVPLAEATDLPALMGPARLSRRARGPCSVVPEWVAHGVSFNSGSRRVRACAGSPDRA